MSHTCLSRAAGPKFPGRSRPVDVGVEVRPAVQKRRATSPPPAWAASLALLVAPVPDALDAPVNGARVDAATCSATSCSAAPQGKDRENQYCGKDDRPDHDFPKGLRGICAVL